MSPRTMKTLLHLLIPLTILCPATGDGGFETLQLQAAVGSSVFLPMEKVDNDTFCDLYNPTRSVIMTCHGPCTIRDPYTKRGHYYQHNGTFRLDNLSKEDSGTYEYMVNMTEKRTFHLLIIDPVKEPVLSLHEESENGSQCRVILKCSALDDGLLNFMLWRYNEVLQNETTYNSSSLAMDDLDVATLGTFYCTVANRVSSKRSPDVRLIPPETGTQKAMTVIACGFLIRWFFGVVYELIKLVTKNFRRPKIKKDGHHNGENQKLKKMGGFFSKLELVLGFLQEIFIFTACVTVPLYWLCALPTFLLICRAALFLISCCNFQNAQLRCGKKLFIEWPVIISDMFVAPAFCITILVIVGKYYRSPCGALDIWPIPIYIFCILLFGINLCIKVLIKRKQKNKKMEDEANRPLKGGVPNGDLDCEAPESSTAESKQKLDDQGEVMTDGASEDDMTAHGGDRVANG